MYTIFCRLCVREPATHGEDLCKRCVKKRNAETRQRGRRHPKPRKK